MVKAIGGKLGKLFSVILASMLLIGCAFMFTACESKRPEISMDISFNGETYTLNYKLYRDLYSQTVAHYIELIDLGYYNGTVIHDYKASDRMIGGGYTYDDLENGDVMDDLREIGYDSFTTNESGEVSLKNITVWKDADRTVATNRLHGEFSGNGFSVENGTALSNSYGALGTYSYVAKNEKTLVTYKQSSSDKYGQSEYYKNSTEGMFYIFLASSGSAESRYCVFGELADEDSKTALDNLLAAIDSYVEGLGDDGAFTETKADVVIEDEFVDGGSYNVDFEVPQSKIVIESVEVTKY